MKQRCLNEKNTSFRHYGKKGITVCERWMKFENFLADMGERPEGLTLERKDSGAGYSPQNCIWASRKTQSRNRSTTKLNPNKVASIRALEGEMTHRLIAEKFGVHQATVTRVLKQERWA